MPVTGGWRVDNDDACLRAADLRNRVFRALPDLGRPHARREADGAVDAWYVTDDLTHAAVAARGDVAIVARRNPDDVLPRYAYRADRSRPDQSSWFRVPVT